MSLSSLAVRARTALSLGAPNIWRVGSYRLGLRLGIHPVRSLQASLPEAPFYGPCALPPVNAAPASSWWDEAQYFGVHPVASGSEPPDWHANPLRGTRVLAGDKPWWEISAFDHSVGDIKAVWEASRFDWVLSFAQRHRGGDESALARLNDWLERWCRGNPAYQGPNWMCGQEASIRVLHLSVAALLLGQLGSPSSGLQQLVRAHLARIAPTIHYAVGQDNNHGTSEAAALFVGGSWLASLGADKEAAAWAALGRRWMEDRVLRLVADDGSFSQYSVTYHRVLLDTLSMLEVLRREQKLEPFSDQFQQRCRAATLWLYALVRREGGDAPNLGANDGARLCPLDDSPYRDFRPSVQLAAALFLGRRAYPAEGSWNSGLDWLGLDLPAEALDEPESSQFDDGGYCILHRGDSMALLRYPRFRFRPSHADALHVDLWRGGENLLRDGGSYSYSEVAPGLDGYFSGTASHNTVQFDGRDQMPRISRFLFGSWLKTSSQTSIEEDAQSVSVSAAYRDAQGAEHSRELSLSDRSLRVIDRLSGFRSRAVLRWRLRPGDWQLEDGCARFGQESLSVHSDGEMVRMEIVEGWESRHYLERTPVPVLEVECAGPGTLTSEYCW